MAVHPVKLLLREAQALPAFEALVKAGCEETFLLGPLELIRKNWHRHDRSEVRTGLDVRRLKATTKRIRKLADEIKAINLLGFGLELIPPSRFNSLLRLPEMLMMYAILLERPPLARLGRNPTLHLLKFSITQHVKKSLGRFHDEEVAAIIGAVLPGSQNRRGYGSVYDAITHKQWRFEHYRTISRIWEGK